jgi:hypothetical protein
MPLDVTLVIIAMLLSALTVTLRSYGRWLSTRQLGAEPRYSTLGEESRSARG